MVSTSFSWQWYGAALTVYCQWGKGAQATIPRFMLEVSYVGTECPWNSVIWSLVSSEVKVVWCGPRPMLWITLSPRGQPFLRSLQNISSLSSSLFHRPFVVQSLSPVWLFATHGLQHSRLPSPSPTPRVCSHSCPLSQWCHPIISSSFAPFSSCPQFFPASGSFTVSQVASGG